ncbi:TetR/AcrR family transcriptional regulator [Fodinicola acaciae]|uniref:TetR/AcrR family transcriptional regulator n=1 Tax=Fodinicola acaciae TaxID=2681555 RepID=UPI0013D86AAC|nr:TetR family transcriptional regulator [Fodinicola acaciae]
MQAKTRSSKQTLTFTEEARRAQIVAAAIETVAEVGYAKASFARIAKKAGLSSTGMISYHFTGKDELLRAVVADVLRTASEFMQPKVLSANGFPAMLRARIESNVDLLAQRPADLRALVEIVANARTPEGQQVADVSAIASGVDLVEELLRAGQRAGDFGTFDARVMAIAITGAIDALVTRCSAGEELDLARCGAELADLFERATRA